jgi:long-chain acyl-CoA synthetase
MAFAESVEKVAENLVEVQPTIMVSVPRLFEKIYSGILENVHQMPAVRKTIFRWALAVGKEYVQKKYIRKEPLGMLKLKHVLAERLVFDKVKKRFGGRMKFFCSGGAPLDKTINEFFWCMGVPILEGYGLTETSPAVSFNRLDHIRFGSVGCALEGTEFKVADDGELLVKGPQVMAGYYRNEEATAEVLQDGWFKTGDIGQVDAEGFVYITDRKKELIITAGGKNIAPQPIENGLKLDKYISQAYIYGDCKPYLSALITPNLERLFEFAREKQISHFDLDDLVTNQRVYALYEQRIAELNARLAQFETIKKFVLLPRDFSIDGGELTPTLKLRRKVIYEKYREKIEGMYSDGAN